MKIKSLIAITAALVLHSTAALATVFTTNATINIGDTNYDGQDIVVSNSTLTVNGPHRFASLQVISNGVLTHSAAPNGEAGNLLSLTIAGNLGVDTLSRIDASGLGYGGQQGPGAGTGGSGAGHGGTGGNGSGAGGGGYDSVLTPSLWGSGGGAGYGANAGAGGGAICLIVAGTLQLDGVIAADGASAGGYAGGGAGGSIQISAGKLAGGGSISARGGGTDINGGGGGGGGRIALYFTQNTFGGTISAVGGLGGQNGGAGTIYTKLAANTRGLVLVDNGTNAGLTGLNSGLWPASQVFDLTISGAAIVKPDAPLTFMNLVLTNGLLSCVTGQSNLTLTVLGDLTVAAGGRIDVSGLGYAAQQGPGAATQGGSGAGHGGTGGIGADGGGAGGGGYDSVLTPSLWGSGGAFAYGGYAGAGGGAICLIVAGTLQLDGVIAADGASAGGYAGGGAGGSIQISADKLAGGGSISARGGSAVINGGGGGGGGRIALYFTTNNFAGANTAVGGLGYQNGGAGTIYTKLAADAYGQVLVNNGTNNGPNAGLTRLDSSLWSAGIFDLTISNATGYSDGALLLGSLLITTNATITHPAGGPGIQIAVLGDATIQAGAGMVVDGRGYGSATGPGHGISSGYDGSGAGYGGPGGASGENAGGPAYGSSTAPVDLGSGGGDATGANAWGGAGGGAIRLTVSGTLLLNGRVTANGTGGTVYSEGYGAGGGSGGSVFLTVGRLAGNGAITANGGAAGNTGAGGGGGGRIAIYSSTNVFIGTNTAGGGGGGNGTIYLGINVAPMVIAQSPSGPVNRFVSYVDVTFNQPVDPATFTTNDLVLTAASGPIPLGQITLTDGGGVTWRIGFPTQTANGDYSLTVGPHVANLFGQEMPSAYQGAFNIQFTRPVFSSSLNVTNFKLSWPTVAGLNYQLQSTTNLSAASWVNEGAPFTGTGGALTNTISVGADSEKFFRLLLLEN